MKAICLYPISIYFLAKHFFHSFISVTKTNLLPTTKFEEIGSDIYEFLKYNGKHPTTHIHGHVLTLPRSWTLSPWGIPPWVTQWKTFLWKMYHCHDSYCYSNRKNCNWLNWQRNYKILSSLRSKWMKRPTWGGGGGELALLIFSEDWCAKFFHVGEDMYSLLVSSNNFITDFRLLLETKSWNYFQKVIWPQMERRLARSPQTAILYRFNKICFIDLLVAAYLW